jgi:hypothetical protein
MSTPLYKKLKQNGTSFYAFPGSAEDISSAFMNSNNKMYFSKYILLNLPKQQLFVGATESSNISWDFSVFKQSNNASQAALYQDQLVESLRNYVANQEETIKSSKLNNTSYYYDNTVLGTPTEKIFWKWCKDLNLMSFEPAIDGDQYFGNLPEFARHNLNDDSYFPEILWKEREVIEWRTLDYHESGVSGFINKLEVTFNGVTNFRVGDRVNFSKITDSGIVSLNNNAFEVLHITPAGPTQGQMIVFDYNTVGFSTTETTGVAKLVYNRLVQYIGEVQGVNNVQDNNRSYTEVFAHIPDHTGQTPDILFRTESDKNYKPNISFPILPSQYQPEIIGAELFNSPIVNSPQNYPGSFYGQFDTEDFTYETAAGDILRRSGDYFGVDGDINTPVINANLIDGISIDFNTSHYVKMNIIGRELTNFDQFNALVVNNKPPNDFSFNAILWFYNVDDINGNTSTNLYGVSFLDNPDNNPIDSEVGLRIPLIKKLATTDTQDGSSYAFSLNLNYNIINENPQDTFNPEAINSLFSFNLFNEAMKRLSNVNQSFLGIISEQNDVKKQILDVKQLLYSQTDFNTINTKIANLESLLKLYSSNQLISSDTIEVELNNSTSPPLIQFRSKDATYFKIDNINTTDLYTTSGIIPINVHVPDNKNFLIYVTNNDETNLKLPNNNKLVVVLDRDLDFRQSFDIIVSANDFATQNKKLDIFLRYQTGNNLPIETKLFDTIDLPIFRNNITQNTNSAKNLPKFSFDIDLNKDIKLNTGNILDIPLVGTGNLIFNSIKAGDTLFLENFIIGASSSVNFSGQYVVDSVGATNSTIKLVVDNEKLISFGSISSLPYVFNTGLSNRPYFRLNKGIKYKVTRVVESHNSPISSRYLIESEIR